MAERTAVGVDFPNVGATRYLDWGQTSTCVGLHNSESINLSTCVCTYRWVCSSSSGSPHEIKQGERTHGNDPIYRGMQAVNAPQQLVDILVLLWGWLLSILSARRCGCLGEYASFNNETSIGIISDWEYTCETLMKMRTDVIS